MFRLCLELLGCVAGVVVLGFGGAWYPAEHGTSLGALVCKVLGAITLVLKTVDLFSINCSKEEN